MDIFERGNAIKFEVAFYDLNNEPVDVKECSYTMSNETGTAGTGTMETGSMTGEYFTTFVIDEDSRVGHWVFRVDAVQMEDYPFRQSKQFGVKDVSVTGSL